MRKKARNVRNVAQYSLPGLGAPAQLSLAPNAEDWKRHPVPAAPKPDPEERKGAA